MVVRGVKASSAGGFFVHRLGIEHVVRAGSGGPEESSTTRVFTKLDLRLGGYDSAAKQLEHCFSGALVRKAKCGAGHEE